MPTYDVTLSRAYLVKVRARTGQLARRTAQFFLVTPKTIPMLASDKGTASS